MSYPSSPSSSSSPAPHPSYNPNNPHLQNNPLASNSHSSPSNTSISTPNRSSNLTPNRGNRPARRNGRHSPPRFTESMQDAQARNKDPYESSDSSEEGTWSGRRWDAFGNDSYENIQQRRMAAVILDSPELLMMHSQARCDSIPGTRHYFTKLLCGYHDEADTYPIDGQVSSTKDKEREKDRERVERRRRAFEGGNGGRR